MNTFKLEMKQIQEIIDINSEKMEFELIKNKLNELKKENEEFNAVK